MHLNFATMESPLEGIDFRCPVCDMAIPVINIVEVQTKGSHINGSTGFTKHQSTHIESKVVGTKIEHSCKPREE